MLKMKFNDIGNKKIFYHYFALNDPMHIRAAFFVLQGAYTRFEAHDFLLQYEKFISKDPYEQIMFARRFPLDQLSSFFGEPEKNLNPDIVRQIEAFILSNSLQIEDSLDNTHLMKAAL